MQKLILNIMYSPVLQSPSTIPPAGFHHCLLLLLMLLPVGFWILPNIFKSACNLLSSVVSNLYNLLA